MTRPYLILLRPANIVTAIADILAGIAIAGVTLDQLITTEWWQGLLLVLSTIGLYGGGVVFNDYFDADLDGVERPERPIPSGQVSKSDAARFGTVLLLTGIFAATLVNLWSGLLAFLIAGFALIYDKYAKHHAVLGPFTMALCRAGNLLLGVSIVTASLFNLWPVGLLPFLFIAAVTITSQGEAIGNNRMAIALAIALDLAVALILVVMGVKKILNLTYLLPLLVIWLGVNLQAKVRAIVKNEPKQIMNAVKTGVLSLILLDASYAASFGNLLFGLIVVALLPISLILAKKFAVT